MGMLLAYSHMTNPLLEVNPGQSTLNRIQTTSRSGLSQTGLKPLWLNAHSRLDSVNANQCALNRIECALSVQCERALNVQSELDGVTRNRSIYARTFFPWRLSVLCVLRNRRKAHSKTSSTASRRGTIDGRDASLLSMVELPFFTRRTARA